MDVHGNLYLWFSVYIDMLGRTVSKRFGFMSHAGMYGYANSLGITLSRRICTWSVCAVDVDGVCVSTSWTVVSVVLVLSLVVRAENSISTLSRMDTVLLIGVDEVCGGVEVENVEEIGLFSIQLE